MQACASPFYSVALPGRHPFPMAKYRLVRERLLGERTLYPRCLIEPPQAPIELLALVHTEEYLMRERGCPRTEAGIRSGGMGRTT